MSRTQRERYSGSEAERDNRENGRLGEKYSESKGEREREGRSRNSGWGGEREWGGGEREMKEMRNVEENTVNENIGNLKCTVRVVE